MTHQIVSPYRVVEQLADGLIKVMDSADDTRRCRFVKFPPREFSKDTQPEPLATSALNQPNVKLVRGGRAWA